MPEEEEDLASRQCQPCRKGAPPLEENRIARLMERLPDWRLAKPASGTRRLARTYRFKNFARALAFANRVGELAEEADHHPRLIVDWGKLVVHWTTHAAGDVHENDFVMAARCDKAYGALK